MPGEDDKKKMEELSMQIKELQAQLSELTAASRPQDVSADEIRAYQKVRRALGGESAAWIDECGINECQPLRGIPSWASGGYVSPLRRWRVTKCINECTCGPCNMELVREALDATRLELETLTNALRGGSGRFGGLG